MMGKSLAHFFWKFFVVPVGEEGANFGTNRFCEMESSNCLTLSEFGNC